MTYPVTKYRCSHCHSEWGDPIQAQRCEELPVPERAHKVGDEIIYGAEDSLGLGGRWCYSSASGKIVGYRLVMGHEQSGPIHSWLYAVQEEGAIGMDGGLAGVFQYPDGRLQSPAEFRRIKMGPEFVKEGAPARSDSASG